MEPYIIFGSFSAKEGKSEELLEILLSGHDMNEFPGCREYRVFMDAEDSNKLWIFETWDSYEAHQASLLDDVIRGQIEKAMPLIASFGEHHTLLEAN